MKLKPYLSKTAEIMSRLHPDLRPYFDQQQAILRHPMFLAPLFSIHCAEKANESYEKLASQRDHLLADVRFNPGAYLTLFLRSTVLNAFLDIQNRISDAQYWHCLSLVWNTIEHVATNTEQWLDLFRSPRRHRALFMSRADRKVFSNLPAYPQIYRGYQQDKNELGLSWTVSREKAVWFAHRNAWDIDDCPRVLTGTCKREDVLFYNDGRDEQEIIVDPLSVTIWRDEAESSPSPLESRQD